MAIIGIGVDIESIASFKNKAFNKNRHFYERLFTKKEIGYCLKKANPYQHFAARFCAKEAFIKAVGGISDKSCDYRDIEIGFKIGSRKKGKHRKPGIQAIKSPTIELSTIKSVGLDGMNLFLSMSHDNDKAVAFVVVESGGKGRE